MNRHVLAAVVVLFTSCTFLRAADAPPAKGPGDEMLREYFEAETDAIAKQCLADIHSAQDWDAKKGEYRRELAEMLGLWPAPEKTDLKATITGTVDHPQFTVEKLYFQSRPGLYVTANLYIPKGLTAPAPTILYVCGHGNVKQNGISYGSKVALQHWPGWFARNGYVCLILDTLELGEIEGHHHGTYREGMWWWQDRGYTPAGVEAWNSIRALDYLETRPEVDKTRLGITGRSGGGAYSWWVTALDDRIKVAVPTAGITDLHNHVVDGTVEGHCDCMFMVNTYRWDFGQVAALAAPRPLLIANSDKDLIFPLDGVYRVHQWTRGVYDLTGSAKTNLGLVITEGPHKDTQDLQVPTFHWFNRHFKADETPIGVLATPLFKPEQLRVFEKLPADQINTKIQETFVPQAPPPRVPGLKEDWAKTRDGWMAALREKTFGGWPRDVGSVELKPVQSQAGVATYEFVSQAHVPLRLFVTGNANGAESVVLHVLDDAGWAAAAPAFVADPRRLTVYVAPRGVGPTAFSGDEKKRTQILRRFPLIGQTLEGMQVWDVRRAIQAVRMVPGVGRKPIALRAQGRMAGVALYASLFEPGIAELELRDLPPSHVEGPHLLNVLKTLDMPAAVAMAAERTRVKIREKEQGGWQYPREVAAKMGWGDDRVQVP
jgi:dienelactone hydrolase